MSEVRLIDVNRMKEHVAFQKDILANMGKDMEEIGNLLVNMINEEIDLQPTVDAVPVRHGKWIYTTLKRYKEYTVTCPFCGAKYHDCYDGYIDVDDFNYCPNCGAKMDGADGERRSE